MNGPSEATDPSPLRTVSLATGAKALAGAAQNHYHPTMPKRTEQELAQLVQDGEIAGFTLDTTEFHHVGYNYQSKILQALGQFVETDVTLLFSEVVLNEVHAHVRDDLKTKSDQLRSAIRQVGKAAALSLDPTQVMADLGIPEDAGARSTELLGTYVASVGATRLDVDAGPTVRQLHDLYFGSKAPFSAKADKKSEFPDAIALLSLEQWGAEQGGFVLAVSADSDWARFADQSPSVICVSELAAALNLFNADDAFVAARLAANLAAGTAALLSARIQRALEASVEVFDVEASAPYYYESQNEYATIEEWSVAEPRFDVLTSDADFVTLAFPVAVKATFEASFSFTVRDGIDKDYVGIGGAQASKSEEFDVQVVVTVSRDDDGSDPEVVDLEIDASSLSVDFGYIEVDYGDDYDDW